MTEKKEDEKCFYCGQKKTIYHTVVFGKSGKYVGCYESFKIANEK